MNRYFTSDFPSCHTVRYLPQIGCVFFLIFFQEKKNLLSDLSAIGDNLKMKEKEVQRLEEMIDSIQEDKSRLSNKVNKLTSSGKISSLMYVKFLPCCSMKILK